MSDSVFAVGTTAAQISLPPVRSVLVLNSSGGLGDSANAATIVVNNSSACSISPQQGMRLDPGEVLTVPLWSPSTDDLLPLFAIASADAQLTVTLFE